MSSKKITLHNLKPRQAGDSSIAYNSKKGLYKIHMVYSSPNSYFDSNKSPELYDIVERVGLDFKKKKEEYKVIYVSENKEIIRVEGVKEDLSPTSYNFLRNEKIKDIIDNF